jgi:23S rRNA (cytidine1920-2'-O)/16S rRNA (cytidine1409-2'-O)-methyltransferase
MLLAGHIRVGAGDGARSDRKPGEMVDPSVPLERLATPRFVSRGGEKLAAALDAFEITVGGCVCLDVGASTGGFTDCLLQRGASRVYALDVGRGQLAESLRADPRVISLERTHARRLDPADPEAITLPEPVDLAVIDVSFISVTRILAGVVQQVVPGGMIVSLVKPQFESEPRVVPKGVVRDPAVQARAVDRVREAAIALSLDVRGHCASPLIGPAGNREFFLHLLVPG